MPATQDAPVCLARNPRERRSSHTGPFTHAVELVRFALYGRINWISLAVVGGCTALFMVGAILAYDPSRGLLARRGEP